jgi:tRNA(Ile2)-agmatinylcytidine synthase
MNQETSPLTFNNIDPETGRILITPRGPDPILYGIRGESPEAVKQAHEMIHSQEPIERWVIFRTNHGTDAHLRRVGSISEIQPFSPVVVQGELVREPKVIPGGHVIFPIGDGDREVDCAAYEPTGALRETAKRLIAGDFIEACGGVRQASSIHPTTINLEKIRILKLAPKISFFNPRCPHCSKRMKSMGYEKGFRCGKCGFRSSKLEKVAVRDRRVLKKGLYVTSQRSQRHLAKPMLRYGKEKVGVPEKMIANWQSP